MAQSTRDAILALRSKKAMDVFETAESDEVTAASHTTSSYYTGAAAGAGGSVSGLLRSDRKKNEDVLQLDLKPSLAFAKFAGKIYDSKLTAEAGSGSGTTTTTSSSRVQPLPFARPASPTSFSSSSASSSSFSSLSSHHFEAPIDKFNRLKSEIGLFRTDLAALAKEDGTDGSDVGELAALLDRELGKLDEQLTGLAREGASRQLLTDGQATGETGDGVTLLTQLIQRLQQSSHQSDSMPPITLNLPAVSPASPSTSAADTAASYAAMSTLDRRVAALEQTVGLPVGLISAASARDKFSASASRPLRASLSAAPLAASSSSSASPVYLSYSSLFPDLYTGVMSLHRKLHLLDPARMDTLRAHIKSVTQDMELINPSAAAPATASTASASSSSSGVDVRESGRVSELYELMTRWDAWVGQLPVVVSRLQSLKATHDDLRGLADRVRRLETDGAAMDQLLRDDREALQKVSGAATGSLEQMSTNLQSMQQRMTVLQAKLDALNKK